MVEERRPGEAKARGCRGPIDRAQGWGQRAARSPPFRYRFFWKGAGLPVGAGEDEDEGKGGGLVPVLLAPRFVRGPGFSPRHFYERGQAHASPTQTTQRPHDIDSNKITKPIDYPAFFILGLGPGAHLRWA